jgi:putative spermidine/putrescine transport system substrate-binding protein
MRRRRGLESGHGREAEGMLTTIALPHDWCGYGGVIEGFKVAYPNIEVNELNPDAGSADELEAIRANSATPAAGARRDRRGPVLRPAGAAGRADPALHGLDLGHDPRGRQGPEGNWYGDYYGVMSLVVNTDLVDPVPTSFADLLNPEYAGWWRWRAIPAPRTRRSSR